MNADACLLDHCRCCMIDATSIKSRATMRQHREAEVKAILSGIAASILAIAATAATAQTKPPLKLGAILDMSGLYADIGGRARSSQRV
jgi:hypothetical protein